MYIISLYDAQDIDASKNISTANDAGRLTIALKITTKSFKQKMLHYQRFE